MYHISMMSIILFPPCPKHEAISTFELHCFFFWRVRGTMSDQLGDDGWSRFVPRVDNEGGGL